MDNKIESFFTNAALQMNELFQAGEKVGVAHGGGSVLAANDTVEEADGGEGSGVLLSDDGLYHKTGDTRLDEQLLRARVSAPAVSVPKGPRPLSELGLVELLREIGTTGDRLQKHNGYYPERAADERRNLALRLELDSRGVAARVQQSGPAARCTTDQWKPRPLAPGQYELRTRSYAPFETFGSPDFAPTFRGDNRTASARLDVTSRVTEATVIEARDQTSPMRLIDDRAYSDASHLEVVGDHTLSRTARPATQTSFEPQPGHARIAQHLSGSNPLVSVAPDIDVKTDLFMTRREHEIVIQGSMKGDAFPNAEMLLTDAKGQTLLIHTYATEYGKYGGPYIHLPGDGDDKMGTFAVSIHLDDDGNFVGVEDPDGDDLLTVEQWNNHRIAVQ